MHGANRYTSVVILMFDILSVSAILSISCFYLCVFIYLTLRNAQSALEGEILN